MKNILLFFLFVSVACGINAQEQERFLIGVKGGYTLTRFGLSNYDQRVMQIEDRDSQSGYLAGLYTRVRVFKGLSFQPEFYYAKKKGEISFSGVNSDFPFPDTSFVTNIKSWELPLLVHLRLINFEVGNIFAVAGPVVSFVKDGSTDPGTGFVFDNSNWTMMLGGGVEFWRFTFDARYEWGLSNSATFKFKNKDINEFYRMFTFSVGFKLFGI